MSKLFYDHLVVFEDLEKQIDKVASSKEEKDELWEMVDGLVHHKALDTILSKLPLSLHEEFLDKFHSHPHDEAILDYLKDKVGGAIEDILRQELGNLAFEIIEEIASSKGK